jgi:hypothetical protein
MTSPRLRTDFWIAALRRRAEAAGAYISIARRGAEEAGAIFIQVDRRDGCYDLYGPAPQSVFTDGVTDRLFTLLARKVPEHTTRARIEEEVNFDPDLWLVDIEDREGRAFIETVPEDSDERFTSR